jgi:hypothetical protein
MKQYDDRESNGLKTWVSPRLRTFGSRLAEFGVTNAGDGSLVS